MIVFDLKCAVNGHVFEAWFASSAAFEDQCARRLLSCPLCGDGEVGKAVMAPNVGAKGNRTTSGKAVPMASPGQPSAPEVKAFMAALAKTQTAMLENSTWVGKGFASQARAMDAGEIERATIHGEASTAEARALVEDGIGVLPLPFPVVPPEQCN